MAVTITEKIDSRSTSIRGSEFLYIISGTTDDIEAVQELWDQSPATYSTFYKNDAKVEPIGDPTISGMWTGTVSFGPPDPNPRREVGESVFSFDTGGGTQHITTSLAHIQSYAPSGESYSDYKGAINVSGSGPDLQVDGTEIVAPVYNFSETHYFDFDDVDEAYRLAVFNATGKTNNAAFRGFSTGEVLFLGASGTVRGYDADWEISFRFSASKNVTGKTIGSIEDIDKDGWEYMWVVFDGKEDGTTKKQIKQPTEVHIEQVYDSADFSTLGI